MTAPSDAQTSASPATTEAVVDLGAIAHNIATIAATTSAAVMAVVKADGFGHGLVPVARAAIEAGATWYLWRPDGLADGSIARHLTVISYLSRGRDL